MSDEPRPPAAVLFDLDGTLIDSEGLWLIAERQVMAGLGATWTPSDQQHCLGGPLERVSAYMIAKAGVPISVSEVGDQLMTAMEALLRTGPIQWRPGAAELVRSCQAAAIPTGLVSATYRQLLHAVSDAVAEQTGGRGFDMSVAGDEVTDGKPHPEPYLTAATRLGVDIRRCVVIEDSPTGVTAGHASGALVVAVPHMVPIEPAPRLVVLDTLVGVTPRDLAMWLAAAER